MGEVVREPVRRPAGRRLAYRNWDSTQRRSRSSRPTASSPRCCSRTRSRRSSRRATSWRRHRRRGLRAAVGRAAGAQPLDGRLLRRRPGPARRHGPDLPERRRRRGRRDPLGARARTLRRDPAAGRAARLAGCRRCSRPTTSRSGRCARSSTCRSTTTAAQSGPTSGATPASMAICMIELGWFSHRVFWHLVFGGVFDRHPGLKLVLTEQSAGWVPGHARVARPPLRALR